MFIKYKVYRYIIANFPEQMNRLDHTNQQNFKLKNLLCKNNAIFIQSLRNMECKNVMLLLPQEVTMYRPNITFCI